MIDPHVHLRDWGLKHKETLEHGLLVAGLAGLDGVFDMPNTSPAITTEELVRRRLDDAQEAQIKVYDQIGANVFYGLYVGVTGDVEQVKRAAQLTRECCQRQGSNHQGVVGLKMFAGKSVGDLSVIKEDEQRKVYETLAKQGFTGVLAVHCEHEGYIKNNLWMPEFPASHSFARFEDAEDFSVADQIKFAEETGFKGILYIVHVSTPSALERINHARSLGKIRIRCGLTPHHAMLSLNDIPNSEEGLLDKVNPPLRRETARRVMLNDLKAGFIDWIESDHAPHTLAEKISGNYMSGFPGFPFLPIFIDYLRTQGFPEYQIHNLTHRNIEQAFQVNIEQSRRKPRLDLHTEYEVDVYKNLRARLGR